jgi:hypothetical protein
VGCAFRKPTFCQIIDCISTILKSRIQAEPARTKANYLEQPARDEDVLEEMEELIQVRDRCNRLDRKADLSSGSLD